VRDCCRAFDLSLGPGERERLGALDWAGRESDLVGARPADRVTVAGLDDSHQLSRRPDGACIYLGPENQCRIHQHFWPEAMPLMCRLYPFGFYAMGERTAVDVSFSCRSVSQGSGSPIGETVAVSARLLGAEDSIDTRQHRIRNQVPIDASTMWEIEHQILSLLADASLTPVDRIRCVLQFVRLATTGDPAQPTAALLRKALATGIPMQIRNAPLEATMDRTQRAVFYQWLHLALNPASQRFHTLAPAEQATVRTQHESAGRRFRDRDGTPTVDGVELGVDFDSIALVQTDIFASGDCRPVLDFLCAKIIGQKFLTAGQKELPLVEAALKFLICFPMAVWTSKAVAADRVARRWWKSRTSVRRSGSSIARSGKFRHRSCHASNGTPTTGS
jgi:Fe-S-cluster containining protein